MKSLSSAPVKRKFPISAFLVGYILNVEPVYLINLGVIPGRIVTGQ
jgi:hypothetical protein